MYCEKCKKTIEEETSICPDCGSTLIEYTPILNQEDAEILEMVSQNSDEPEEEIVHELTPEEIVSNSEPSILLTIIGDDQVSEVLDLLEANSIPAFTDKTITDEGEAINILVPEELIPEALEILNTVWLNDENTDDELSDEELDELLNNLADETAQEDI